MNEFNPNFQDPDSPENRPEKPPDPPPPTDDVIGMAPSLRKKGMEPDPALPGMVPFERIPIVPDHAGRTDRFFARIIDLAATGIGYFIMLSSDGDGFGASLGFFFLLALAIYQIYLLTTRGQTIGKQTMKIKIVREDNGEQSGFVRNVLLREFLNGLLAFLPFYGLVDILFIFRADQRCIHDHIAGTRVVNA